MSQKNTTEVDVRFSKLAIAVGYRSIGQTWPNPSVGCVLVKDGTIVGTGYTEIGGRPHAEFNAIKEAGKLSDGATAYITLEPCSHFGKAPPCAVELIRANIKRVVCPLEDPDPRVSGNGFKLLEEHGIQVDRISCLTKEARKLAEGFLKVAEKKRPFIALKLALSLNGKIATRSNESNWISGNDSRTLVHFLRSRYDAVMVGKKTALVDNPNLNLRGQFSLLPSPKKIILDRELTLPKTSNFAKNNKNKNLIIVHDRKYDSKALRKWNQNSVNTLGVRADQKNGIDLPDLSMKLANIGLTRILVEGGGDLATSLLNQGLVDLLILFTAGILVDKEGLNGFNPIIKSSTTLSESPKFSLERTFRVGNDVAHLWRPLDSKESN